MDNNDRSILYNIYKNQESIIKIISKSITEKVQKGYG